MYNSLEGLELSAVSKKKTQGTAAFDMLHDDDEVFSDYGQYLNFKDDEELNVEQDYLHKLKIQRERMQKLSKCYHQKEQQLERQFQRNQQLLSEIQRLTNYLPFKEKFDNLKQNYDELLLKYQIVQGQMTDVKEELGQVICQNNQTVSRLKTQLKLCKQNSTINFSQLEQCLCDKEEEIKRIKRDYKDKENGLNDQIKSLKNTIAKLKNQLDNEAKIFQHDREKWNYEIKLRDGTILELQKSLQNIKRQNVDLKNDVMRFSEQVHNRQQQLGGLCSKFKNQLNQTKKAIHIKQSMLEETQNQLKKSQSITYQLQGQLQDMRIQYKKACEIYQNSNKKLKYDSNSQIVRLESFVKQLKQSIEELMEVKNHLIIQNRKLIAIIRKKQHNQKQRKQILKTQLKQIDRIQKVIDKIH